VNLTKTKNAALPAPSQVLIPFMAARGNQKPILAYFIWRHFPSDHGKIEFTQFF
jgi:hypothetical protein